MVFLTGALVQVGEVFAQNIGVSPNDTFEQVGFMEDLETLTISLKNLSPSTVIFKWQKVSESVPANWDAAVCDNKICYAGLEDSGTMNPVDSQGSAFLLLHITSHSNYGKATVRYCVWDEQNPQWKDTLTFILRVDPPSGIGQLNVTSSILIYPNPAQDFLHIHTNNDKGFDCQIFTITGDRVSGAKSETDEVILSIKELKAGIYFLRIQHENGYYSNNKITIRH